jgi:L-threonylcarbamoyladenylate synthase
LTIIYDGAKNLAENLIAEDGSIAIRITRETFSSQLCARMKVPVVSTSANMSGEPTPRNYAEISDEIVNSVDYTVRFRQDDLSRPTPSSILKLGSNGEVKIIRE